MTDVVTHSSGFKCECALRGLCTKHNRVKSSREVEICQGTSGLSTFQWEQYLKGWGELHKGAPAATVPGPKVISTPRRKLYKKATLVGNKLANRIAGLSVTSGAGCGCKDYVKKMNAWGIEGCEQRKATIINHLVSQKEVLASAIKDSNIPGCGLLASLLNTRAATPILRQGASWLLDKAIEDSREESKNLLPSIDVDNPDVYPFTTIPRLTIISHVYPRKDTWEYHIEKLAHIEDKFDTRLLGVATDENTDSFETIQRAFPKWDCFEVKNDPGLREVATYPQMFQEVASSNPNDVIFCHHFKGSQEHTKDSPSIRWWIDAMYDTVIYNIDDVLYRMANGAHIVGSFRRHGRMLASRHRWHFSGTYYAFRAAKYFPIAKYPITKTWWGTEQWPGRYTKLKHSSCVFGDFAGDLYKEDERLKEELEAWACKEGTP